jgi:general nucleoside transport system ATP-binding protein
MSLLQAESEAGGSGRSVALHGITKRYGALTANDDVSVEFRAGEIHVIVGENGAGKSTMMSILAGVVHPDAGHVVIDGSPVRLRSARDATLQGIGMVYQHFQLVDVFTVAENVALGFERRRRFGGLDLDATRAEVRRVSAEFGLALDPDAVVGTLPVGVQQRVEIVKVLLRDPQVLIFDEPTAVLTEDEADRLLAILRRLRDGGRAVVFITHKLREALAVGDRITVLRRGQVVGRVLPADVDSAQLGAMMVGRDLHTVTRSATAAPATAPGGATPVLSVRHVSYRSADTQGTSLRDLTFDVAPGEVLGIVGVDGNGQDELAGVLTGAHAPSAGAIVLDDRNTSGWSVADFLRAGVGVVPADRQRQGLALSMSIGRNLLIDRRNEARFTRWHGLLVDDAAVRDNAAEMITKFDIRAAGPMAPAASLSGGNQQKVILARELERDIRLLITSQPTRGLDVGSIEYVHGRLLEVAAQGCAVVLITSELDEALALSDRIIPLFEGRALSIETAPFVRERLGLLIGGGA